MVTLDELCVWSNTYLYHTHIWIHVSLQKGGSDAGRDSTTDPTYAALYWRYPWKIALIRRPRRHTDLCSPPLLLDLARLNPLVNEASGLCKYPRPTHAFPLRWFGYFPTEFCEKATHVACVLWWSNGEAVLVSKLVRVFPCQ